MRFQALFKEKYIYKAFSIIVNYGGMTVIYIGFDYLIILRVFIIE